MMNLWKGTVRRVGATLLACVLLLGLLPQLPRQFIRHLWYLGRLHRGRF